MALVISSVMVVVLAVMAVFVSGLFLPILTESEVIRLCTGLRTPYHRLLPPAYRRCNRRNRPQAKRKLANYAEPAQEASREEGEV